METFTDKTEKPIHVKPAFYAYLYEPLKIKAKELGVPIIDLDGLKSLL